MDYKNDYKLEVGIRIVGLTISAFLLANFVSQDFRDSNMSITTLIIFILCVIQAAYFINFLDNIQQEINGIINNLRHDRLSKPLKLSTREGTYTAQLKKELNRLVHETTKISQNEKSRYNYLMTIVQHAGFSILTFDEKGDVLIFNNAARKAFDRKKLVNIDELKSVSEELVEQLHSLKTGGRALVKIKKEEEVVQLAIYAIELQIEDKPYKLITIQNIRRELEQNELEAWEKLVRVLTHEIMNSVTPISSLTATVAQELEQHRKIISDGGVREKPISAEELEDIYLAIQTIQRRSESLIHFVNDFRSMTHIPKPNLRYIRLCELLSEVNRLLEFDIKETGAELEISCPKEISLNIDAGQIQQVLINLIQNALDAVRDRDEGHVWISVYQDDKEVTHISVRDNGKGIEEEALQKIFIPFFTTKKNGSGIGLSLSKQIVSQHLGTLSVKSQLGFGTEFLIKL
ncbi:MAG: ATP-binding protein [Cytophagales bacterium]|nr:ATP-binding protein [Cytophagales bacterium]